MQAPLIRDVLFSMKYPQWNFFSQFIQDPYRMIHANFEGVECWGKNISKGNTG